MDTSVAERRQSMATHPPLMPTYYPGDLEDIPEELYDEDLFQFNEPTISFDQEQQAKSWC